MGLAASQARYLALTARKSDLEFQSQTINTRRIQLAYKTAEIAQAYSDGMNNRRIKMSTKNSKGDTVWEEVSFSDLLKEGYVVIPANGQSWNSIGVANNTSPYTPGSETDVIYYVPKSDAGSLTEAQYNALSNSDKAVYEKSNDSYVLRSYITATQYSRLTDATKGKLDDPKTSEVKKQELSVNPGYITQNPSMDIQALLESGKAQIVTKAFYDYLFSNGYDPYEADYPIEAFLDKQEEWDNIAGTRLNPSGQKSVCDWRADETETFAQRNFTEDDAQVLAKYEADTAEIQRQDKILETQEKNIETQHKAIETELESISKVIQKNIETTFKIFS